MIKGAETTVIAAIGEEREGMVETLEPGAGVEKVLPIRAPYKRASSELKSESHGRLGPRACRSAASTSA